MQLLVIKIRHFDKNPEYALLGKKQTQGNFTTGDWKRVRSLTRGRKILVLLSSNEIVLTSAVIPSKNRKQLLQAIPYALEDTLAEDIDDLHFAVHQDTNSDDNNTQVAIINRNVLAKTLDLLKSKRINANFILPEVLSQKFEEDSYSIIYENTNNHISSSVRLGRYEGFFCDQKMLDMFLAEPLENKIPSSVFSNTKIENLPLEIQELNNKYIESNTIEYKSAISALDLNLLTNFVRQNQQNSSINWKCLETCGIFRQRTCKYLGWNFLLAKYCSSKSKQSIKNPN